MNKTHEFATLRFYVVSLLILLVFLSGAFVSLLLPSGMIASDTDRVAGRVFGFVCTGVAIWIGLSIVAHLRVDKRTHLSDNGISFVKSGVFRFRLRRLTLPWNSIRRLKIIRSHGIVQGIRFYYEKDGCEAVVTCPRFAFTNRKEFAIDLAEIVARHDIEMQQSDA